VHYKLFTMTTWQKLLAVIMAACLLVYRGCTLGEYRVTKRITNKVEHDSVSAFTILPVPVLILKSDTQYVAGKAAIEHDTLETEKDGKPYPVYVELPSETPRWVVDDLNDYNITRKYDTVLNGKRDTASISFNVRRNKVNDWNLKLTSHDSTKFVYPPKKFVLSFYPTVIGNLNDLVFAYGIGFDFKFPKDDGFNLSALRVPSQPKGQRMMFQLSKKFPIRLNIFSNLKPKQ